MIGLDGHGETSTCVTSSGGRRLTVRCPVGYAESTAPCRSLTVDGLRGGHSGGCIDQGLGNAILLGFRILYQLLERSVDVRIAGISGGAKMNAIPRQFAVLAEKPLQVLSVLGHEGKQNVFRDHAPAKVILPQKGAEHLPVLLHRRPQKGHVLVQQPAADVVQHHEAGLCSPPEETHGVRVRHGPGHRQLLFSQGTERPQTVPQMAS